MPALLPAGEQRPGLAGNERICSLHPLHVLLDSNVHQPGSCCLVYQCTRMVCSG
jgi:hypothetical protein